ncbi:hypothetical protein QUA84_12630 [Microcoleus sp. F8-C3]
MLNYIVSPGIGTIIWRVQCERLAMFASQTLDRARKQSIIPMLPDLSFKYFQPTNSLLLPDRSHF